MAFDFDYCAHSRALSFDIDFGFSAYDLVRRTQRAHDCILIARFNPLASQARAVAFRAAAH